MGATVSSIMPALMVIAIVKAGPEIPPLMSSALALKSLTVRTSAMITPVASLPLPLILVPLLLRLTLIP